jgi:hypothetical protein
MTEEQKQSIRRTIRKVVGTKTFNSSIKPVDDCEVWITLTNKLDKSKTFTIVLTRPTSSGYYEAELEENESMNVVCSCQHKSMLDALEGVLTKLKAKLKMKAQ